MEDNMENGGGIMLYTYIRNLNAMFPTHSIQEIKTVNFQKSTNF